MGFHEHPIGVKWHRIDSMRRLTSHRGLLHVRRTDDLRNPMHHRWSDFSARKAIPNAVVMALEADRHLPDQLPIKPTDKVSNPFG